MTNDQLDEVNIQLEKQKEELAHAEKLSEVPCMCVLCVLCLCVLCLCVCVVCVCVVCMCIFDDCPC